MRAVPVVLVVLALAVGVTACGSAGGPPVSTGASTAASTTARRSAPPVSASTRAAAARFLAGYVASDGRVIRHDQGGDIVSEGQAYGMLLAQVAGRPALVRTIWSWTSAHLGRSDGLFAWHATGSGQIENQQSATDADVLIAYALLRYTGPDQAALHRAGRRVAGAVLANESIELPGGAPLLVAGPWARSASPQTVDPSYLMPGVFTALAAMTGDQRWKSAAGAAVTLLDGLTSGGARLPSDWAKLSGSRLEPIPEPGGGAPVQYSFDAARLPVWFATACDSRARGLAAAWWRNVLSHDDRSAPQALGLDGATIDAASTPLTLLAGAAAATAAGDAGAARSLRIRAGALSLRDPTYYGAAWAALGPALLDGSISPCRDAGL